ncbi:M17 family peptidase N-terminal domain-containing protein [Sphingomonas sp. RS6]
MTDKPEAHSIGHWRGVHFRVAEIDVVAADVDLLVLGMLEPDMAHRARSGASEIDDALHGTLTRLRDGGIFAGRLGDMLVLTQPPAPIQARALMLMGMGAALSGNPSIVGALTEQAMRLAWRLRARSVACLLGWSELAVPDPLVEPMAAAMMRGALRAIDQGCAPGETLACDWTFDIRNGEAQRTANALTETLRRWR